MIKFSGIVVKGEGLGRRLGFPTANISLRSGKVPPRGVWKVMVSSRDFPPRIAACNVGFRPTVGGRGRVIEIHIPKYSGNLYRKRLDVILVEKIRDEIKFPTLAALKVQIRRDIASLTAS